MCNLGTGECERRPDRDGPAYTDSANEDGGCGGGVDKVGDEHGEGEDDMGELP